MDKCGIIDIGSNSIRLVVYERLHTIYINELENCKVTARLDNFLDDNNVLNSEGITHVIQILNYFKEILVEYNVTKVEVVATATIRKASNQRFVIDTIKQETNFSIRVLSGTEEANYGVLGILHSTATKNGFTIDIGGGSTEVSYFENRKLKYSTSFPFGILSLKNQFVKQELPTGEELNDLNNFLEDQFNQLNWRNQDCNVVYAIGGSARNIGKLHQYLTEYPMSSTHLLRMNQESIIQVDEFLVPLNLKERQKIESLSKERADTIQLASQVFLQFLKSTNCHTFVVCGKGIREGIYYQEFAFLKVHDSIQQDSIEAFITYHGHNHAKKRFVKEISNKIYDALSEIQSLGKSNLSKRFLEWGSYLYGYADKYNMSNEQYTFHLVLNLELDGFSHKEKLILALISSFKSKSQIKKNLKGFENWLSKDEIHDVILYGAIVKIANSVCISQIPIIKSVKGNRDGKVAKLVFECERSWLVEEQRVQKQMKHIEKVMKREIETCFIRA